MDLEIRPTRVTDLPQLERMCWGGGEDEMRRRIERDGTCSIIALDEGRPVAQLYLRAYEPGYRCPRGVHSGEFWADLKGVEGELELPERLAMLGCWHVGRVRESDGSEREAEEYRARGVGIALAHGAVEWLRRPDTPFDAIGVKAGASDDRAYLGLVGVLSRTMLEPEGFRVALSYDDPYFLAERDFLPDHIQVENPARFHFMVCEKHQKS